MTCSLAVMRCEPRTRCALFGDFCGAIYLFAAVETTVKARSLGVKKLLNEARRVKKRDVYITSLEIAPAINTLREKGLSWREIHEWFAARGHSWNQNSLANSWRHWLKKRGREEPK